MIKTVLGDAFGVGDYLLKKMSYLLYTGFFLDTITDTIECFNFDAKIVLKRGNIKKSLSKLNLCQSIFLTELAMGIKNGFLLSISK